MKRNILIALLLMSAMFNLFFAIGYVRARSETTQVQSTDPEAVQVARELNLDEGQRAAFEQLRTTTRAEQAMFAESLALLRQELTQELGREQPDLEQVRSIISRESELISQRRQAESSRFSTFVGLLNPDQCRKLSERFGGRGPWRGPGPRPEGGPGLGHGAESERPPGGLEGRGRQLFEKFDLNGDGTLDEQERAAAHEAMQERIRRERQRQSEMFDRFDADDDGKLDREELGEWMRWNFEQGRNRPPRPGGPRSEGGRPGTSESRPQDSAQSAPAVQPPL
jgi:hypothetical protein